MRRTTSILVSTLALLSGCEAAPTAPGDVGIPAFHVGYAGPALGVQTNEPNAECHIGTRGARWAYLGSNQWDVIAENAQVVVSASGRVTMTCQGWMPANWPDGSAMERPNEAIIESEVLCFLPPAAAGLPRRQTRKAEERFLPSGRIVLTCHLDGGS